jgi:hypothetical protein
MILKGEQEIRLFFSISQIPPDRYLFELTEYIRIKEFEIQSVPFSRSNRYGSVLRDVMKGLHRNPVLQLSAKPPTGHRTGWLHLFSDDNQTRSPS